MKLCDLLLLSNLPFFTPGLKSPHGFSPAQALPQAQLPPRPGPLARRHHSPRRAARTNMAPRRLPPPPLPPPPGPRRPVGAATHRPAATLPLIPFAPSPPRPKGAALTARGPAAGPGSGAGPGYPGRGRTYPAAAPRIAAAAEPAAAPAPAAAPGPGRPPAASCPRCRRLRALGCFAGPVPPHPPRGVEGGRGGRKAAAPRPLSPPRPRGPPRRCPRRGPFPPSAEEPLPAKPSLFFLFFFNVFFFSLPWHNPFPSPGRRLCPGRASGSADKGRFCQQQPALSPGGEWREGLLMIPGIDWAVTAVPAGPCPLRRAALQAPAAGLPEVGRWVPQRCENLCNCTPTRPWYLKLSNAFSLQAFTTLQVNYET